LIIVLKMIIASLFIFMAGKVLLVKAFLLDCRLLFWIRIVGFEIMNIFGKNMKFGKIT